MYFFEIPKKKTENCFSMTHKLIIYIFGYYCYYNIFKVVTIVYGRPNKSLADEAEVKHFLIFRFFLLLVTVKYSSVPKLLI
jgi:hypothetical protein